MWAHGAAAAGRSHAAEHRPRRPAAGASCCATPEALRAWARPGYVCVATRMARAGERGGECSSLSW